MWYDPSDYDYYGGYGYYRTPKKPVNFTHRPYICQVLIEDSEGNTRVIEYQTYAKNPSDALQFLEAHGNVRITPIMIRPTNESWENFDQAAA